MREAWRNSRDASGNPGAPGVDGVRAPHFASDLADNIERIRQEIRADSYSFNRLRLARVLKDSGGYRILAIPTVRDRLVQRAILRHLEADSRFQPSSEISYGFAKQRTLADAQRAALRLRQSRPWVLKCDIVRFFDRIPRSQLKQLIRRKVGWRVVAGLLCRAVDSELQLRTSEDVELVTQNGVLAGVGLRQGMPVSPILSNLLLKRFDERLEKFGIVAVRYADDIAVFADGRGACEAALKAIHEGLAELDLEVPDLLDGSKTSILGPSEVAEFLGVEIRRKGHTYKLCAPARKIEKIEAAMAAMVQIPKCVEEKRNIGQVVRALESFTIGHVASMAVLEDGGAFMARLEAAKRHQLRALLVNLLGEKVVASLGPDRLAILGVEAFK
ncbi:MAG: reverse transcriptase domain-containing protein [Phenylobacterium sp.]|uniref:reverse transcriptase domain-containing protein n=1 Tax=Phenylobacterium sp. TaxID=1871053 RepID=UPI00391A4EF7